MRYVLFVLLVLVLAACGVVNQTPSPESDQIPQANFTASPNQRFGVNGTMVLDLTTQFNTPSSSRALTVRDDGRIITAVNGVFKDGEGFSVLVGLEPNGRPDGSFNNNGLLPVPASANITDLLIDAGDAVHAVGNIDNFTCGFYSRVAGGQTKHSVCTDSKNPVGFAELAAASSGHLIAAYLTSPGGNQTALSAAISSPTPPPPSPFPNPNPTPLPLLILSRISPDGNPDVSFGTNGKVSVKVSSLEKRLSGVVVLPDNRILVLSNKGTGEGVILSRFSAAGVLEVRQTLTLPDVDPNITEASFFATALTLDKQGKVVLAGQMRVGSVNQAALVRLDPTTLQLDGSFGKGGIAVKANPTATVFSDLKIDPDGRVVAVGSIFSGATSSFLVERYLKNGALDTNFGGGGRASASFDGVSNAQAFGVALTKNGSLIVVGQVDKFVGLARLNKDGKADTGGESGAPRPDTSLPSILSAKLLSTRHAFNLSATSEPKGVDKDTNIVITFSEPMNKAATQAALTSNDPELTPANVSFNWNFEGTVLTIDSKKSLTYQKDIAKRYSFVLAQTARDIAGNALTERAAFAFFTLRQKTETMTTLGNLEGTIDRKNRNNPFKVEQGIIVGDYITPNESFAMHTSRGFFAFSLSQLPEELSTKDILSAKLSLFQFVSETPYADLGSLLLEHVDIGGTLDATEADFNAPIKNSINKFTNKDDVLTAELVTKSTQLVKAVQEARDTGTERIQFRFRFEKNFEGSNRDFVDIFSSLDPDASRRPKLEVTYLTP